MPGFAESEACLPKVSQAQRLSHLSYSPCRDNLSWNVAVAEMQLCRRQSCQAQPVFSTTELDSKLQQVADASGIVARSLRQQASKHLGDECEAEDQS